MYVLCVCLTSYRKISLYLMSAHFSDCPQVQCVHPYIAQEPDELSLDLADLLNVQDRTDDGMYLAGDSLGSPGMLAD